MSFRVGRWELSCGALMLLLAACNLSARGRTFEGEEEGVSNPVRVVTSARRASQSARPTSGAKPAPSPTTKPQPPNVSPAPLPTVRPPQLEPTAPLAPVPPPPAPTPVPPPPTPAPVPPPPAPSEDRTLVRRWLTEVTLGTEFGGASTVVRRFTSGVRVSVMKGGNTGRKELEAAVAALDGLLRPTGVPVELVADGDPTAKIKVFYAAQAEFPSIGTDNGFTYVEGNAGYFHAFWNSDFEIDRVFVLLASDKLSGDSLRHFTFEELTQSFGPARDSDLYSDSVFFADGSDGGSATQLSGLDRKLVTFLYTQLRPGDDQLKVQRAFDQHWH